MARPAPEPIVSQNQGWAGRVDDNFDLTFNRPFAIMLHSGDESDIESTWPAANYDKCFAWVNHSVNGWEFWFSNGTTWAIFVA